LDLISKDSETASSAASVQTANLYSRVIGATPQTFSLAIRNLVLDHSRGSGISPSTEFQLNRLLKAPTLLSSLFYAVKTFYPSCFEYYNKIRPLELAKQFDPLSLAALLGHIYLFRRCKRICNKDEWKHISEPLQRNLEITGKLAQNSKPVGLSTALVSAFTWYAFAMLSAKSTAAFTEYRRYLKKKDIDVDTDYELRSFGCTSAQIASSILLNFGFGVKLVSDYQYAMNITQNKLPVNFTKYPFLLIRLWMGNLQSKIEQGQLPGQEFVALSDDLRKQLILDISACFKAGALYSWLEKGKDSLDAEVMAQLDLNADFLSLMNQIKQDSSTNEESVEQ
jgi:hypothetical protein